MSGSEKRRWKPACESTIAYHHLVTTCVPKPFCLPTCFGEAPSTKHATSACRATVQVASFAPTSSTLRARAPAGVCT
eukprot:scaffold1735_cov66-Phaeocystis_antarctica.AAC.3